jgi:hypothetical protein
MNNFKNINLLLNLLRWKTKIINQSYVKVTDCCKIGPITTENYCPNCGKIIIK